MMRRLVVLGLMLSSWLVQAQGVLTEQQLIEWVKDFHPMAKQGELIIQEAESKLRKAKGGFDPYLFGDFSQKQYKEKEYYNLFNGGVKVPTWFGIEAKAGYEQNRGTFLNPENEMPENGLMYGGISIPIGQGLLIDKRRAVLKQARLFTEASKWEQRKWLNDLFYDAIKAYWNWVEAYNKQLIYAESVDLAKERLDGVRQSFVLGDKPAIDTLEAHIQWQTRQQGFNDIELDYQLKTLELSNFLWTENNTPLEITDRLTPPRFDNILDKPVLLLTEVDSSLTFLESNHPEMLIYDYKLSDLAIEQRLKKEYLKPNINLNYNFLNEPVGEGTVENFTTNNYKWGIDLKFPVLLRKQRGDVELAQLKISNTEWKRKQKLQTLQNKLRGYYNKHLVLARQIDLYGSTVQGYQGLLDGEKQKYTAGESSLFLVNSREVKLIESRVKLIELRAKSQIAFIGISWATGRMGG